MKKILVILVMATLAFGAAKGRGATKGFMGWGIGGGLSLAVPEDGWSYDGYYRTYLNDFDIHYDEFGRPIYSWDYWNGCGGVGPGTEVKGVIRFGIGKGGYIHYTPSISWWGRWENVDFAYTNESVRLHDQEINFNLTDARYVPPIPRTCPVKPYVGFGLLNFGIYTWKEKYNRSGHKNHDNDFNLHQNFFLGSEFELKGDLWPYVDFRMSNGAIDDFVMTVGFTIQGRK